MKKWLVIFSFMFFSLAGKSQVIISLLFGYGFGFSLESLSAPEIRGELRQNLDGDGALQPRVSRTVDLAHPAHTERRRNFIRPKLLTWSQSHR